MTRLIRFSLFLSLAVLAGCGTRLNLADPQTQLNVGVRMARSDLWREAAFRFHRAVELDPGDAMARNNLAVAYEGMGDFEKARVQYTEALRLDRSNEYIQRNYSRFVEFYQRDRKASAATTVATEDADDDAADDGGPATPLIPQPEPEPQIPPPVAQPDPPEPPVSTPPGTSAPNPGGSQ